MDKILFKVGELVKCINKKALPTNDVAPPLEEDKDYIILGIIEDSKGNQHLNVGLKSIYNFITSWDTKEDLPEGKEIHWCHPSRFIKI